jgi:tRNA threonylcarbamoyladenosine biosynthesis protein TsaB
MTLLAIDTATRLISLALHDGKSLIAESTWHSPQHHTVELAPHVGLMLRRGAQGGEPVRLQAVAVAICPGSYTGLRIGLSFAKGLVLAQSLPLLGVPTLDVLARAQPPRPERLLALLQAGRGRVSVAGYAWNSKARRWEQVDPPHVLSWADLAASIDNPVHICGEVEPGLLEQLKTRRGLITLAPAAHALRRAGFLADIAWERLRGQAGPDDPVRLAPAYGTQPDGAAPLPDQAASNIP